MNGFYLEVAAVVPVLSGASREELEELGSAMAKEIHKNGNNIKALTGASMSFENTGIEVINDKLVFTKVNVNGERVSRDIIPAATTESAGIMSAEDKKKIDNVPNAIKDAISEEAKATDEKIKKEQTRAETVEQALANGIANAPNLALRALFIAAGAEYNDTNQIIQKTAPWETEETWVKNTDGTYTYSEVPATVEHLPKHYYLNGLGDITEEEMVEIYSNTFQDMHANDITKYYRTQTFRYKFRTNLRSMGYFTGIGRDGKLYLESAFYANDAVEVVVLNFQKIELDAVGVYNAFTIANSIKHVIGFLKESSTNVDLSIPNLMTINLITCKNVNLTKAILIYKRSILYMIQNATPTSAVTITLHPDAYVRIANQADILEALEAQPLITLVSA